MNFSTKGLTKFKIRLHDGRNTVRFIAIIRLNSDGMHNLWLKWNDFHGEEMHRDRTGITPCEDDDPCRNVNAGNISLMALIVPIQRKSAWSGTFTLHSVAAGVLARPTTTGKTAEA